MALIADLSARPLLDTIEIHGVLPGTSWYGKIESLRDALSVSCEAPVTFADAEKVLEEFENGRSITLHVHFLTSPIVVRDLRAAGFNVE